MTADLCRDLEGRPLPTQPVARLSADGVEEILLHRRLENGRHLLVGMPGAFTPMCDGQHIPGLLQLASQLKRSGIQSINCVVASSPFSVAAWAEKVDPRRELDFFADGNLDFTRALGMISVERELHLGTRSRRYTLMIRHGVIERVRVENAKLELQSAPPEEHVVEL